MRMRNLRAERASISALAAVVLAFVGTSTAAAQCRLDPASGPLPAVAEFLPMATGATPPTEAQCFAAGRRCFSPQTVRSAYNVGPLFEQGLTGQGQTIAIVAAFGNDGTAHDLHVFDQAFAVQPMCGEEGVTCSPGMPTFSRLTVHGSSSTSVAPRQRQRASQKEQALWTLANSTDVETAHAIAPMANILLVTPEPAATQHVAGVSELMDADQFVVDHHLAQVILQGFGGAEESLGSPQRLRVLRHSFEAAAQNGVTVLASSGDSGTANSGKPGETSAPIPHPTVNWPASDPLVTGVGGTYLCTDPTNPSARVVDSVDPPQVCRANPGAGEVGWTLSGGGFSNVFDRPDYQDALPPGSTPIGARRGVPDVALQASGLTGALIFASLPSQGQNGLNCPQPGGGTASCATGWYAVGGTSPSSAQWAGLVAIADQANVGSGGRGLGLINPALYRMAADPARYADDYFDITLGRNQTDPSIPGFPATTGWDPVTGLGTPNAARLVPDLVAAANGR